MEVKVHNWQWFVPTSFLIQGHPCPNIVKRFQEGVRKKLTVFLVPTPWTAGLCSIKLWVFIYLTYIAIEELKVKSNKSNNQYILS